MATAKKRRQYGSGSVHERKTDGRWIGTIEAGWTANGTRRRVAVSASTEKACRDKLKAKNEEIIRDGVPIASVRTTVKTWAEDWLKTTQNDIRPKSWNANRSAVRQWIVPTIGHVKVSALTSHDIERFKLAMIDGGLAPSSMSRNHNVLNKMLKDALIAGFRIHPGVTMVKKIPAGKTPRTAIPLPLALELLPFIEREPDPSRWVSIMLNGLRQGERLGLTWDHVDFDKKIIVVRQQLQELSYRDNKNKHLGFRVPVGYSAVQLVDRWHLVPVKTESGERIVPMTKWMEASLRLQYKRTASSRFGLVWCRGDGMPIDPKDDRDGWRDLQRRSGIAAKAGRTFDVQEGRHTTITFLKEMGYEDHVIEAIVGHSKLVQSYVHADVTPDVRRAIDSMEDRLQLAV
jgi:integrase